MRKFWSYVSNEKYSVGCTDQAAYVYRKTGEEIAKVKDIKHGNRAILCPSQDIFVVKSTGAYFAVYSLEPVSLVKKVKFSNVDCSQDDGFCFSADGKYFYNIERQKATTNSAISVYQTSTFERVNIFLEEDERTEPSFIECGSDGQLFVLGFLRGDNGVIKNGFVSKSGDCGLEDVRPISTDDYDYYLDFKRLELMGFTEKAREWSGFQYRGVDMTGMENRKLPLAELWEKSASLPEL